jgi:uncharacterized protein (TIGR00661 family)
MDTLSPILHTLLSAHFKAEDTVIVAPLNWGLGHATRCIPVIQYLKTICKQVIIASDGSALALLKNEFPDLVYEELPSYNIRYSTQSVFLNMMMMMPSILSAALAEKRTALKIVEKYHATVILSDNRFGFQCPSVKNIYMTHQVNILHNNPILSYLGSKIHQRIINTFDLCLIPDYDDERSLCPKLTQQNAIKKIFLGPLTRIKKLTLPVRWDICVLLSGPEPQRTVLEKALIKQFMVLNQYKILFVTGKQEVNHAPLPKHISIVGLLPTREVEETLNCSHLLIARSGYSTIMDIEQLDIHAIFIPTPGQTEQEYLGKIFSLKPKYHCLQQHNIGRLPEIIEKQFDKINNSQK